MTSIWISDSTGWRLPPFPKGEVLGGAAWFMQPIGWMNVWNHMDLLQMLQWGHWGSWHQFIHRNLWDCCHALPAKVSAFALMQNTRVYGYCSHLISGQFRASSNQWSMPEWWYCMRGVHRRIIVRMRRTREQGRRLPSETSVSGCLQALPFLCPKPVCLWYRVYGPTTVCLIGKAISTI